MAEFAVCGIHAFVDSANIGISCHVHLGDGVGYGSNAVVVTKGGRLPMVLRAPHREPTFEMGVVGLGKVGLKIGPIFLVGRECVPGYDVLNESLRLLDFVKCLVQQLCLRVQLNCPSAAHWDFVERPS